MAMAVASCNTALTQRCRSAKRITSLAGMFVDNVTEIKYADADAG